MKAMNRCEVLGKVQDIVTSCLDTKEYGTFTITVKMARGKPVAVTDDIGIPFTPTPLDVLTVEKYW